MKISNIEPPKNTISKLSSYIIGGIIISSLRDEIREIIFNGNGFLTLVLIVTIYTVSNMVRDKIYVTTRNLRRKHADDPL